MEISSMETRLYGRCKYFCQHKNLPLFPTCTPKCSPSGQPHAVRVMTVNFHSTFTTQNVMPPYFWHSVTYLHPRVAVCTTPYVDEVDQEPYPVDALTALVDSVPFDAVQSDVVKRPQRHQSDGADDVCKPGSEPVPVLGARRQDEVRAEVRRAPPQQQIGPHENDE